ncbi:RsmB/NOP family class I SAM-dependent RNA methyltransferase [Acidimangrovimonas pyrenivorans]|uniref:RsmB/NOP family class I SAM-dependent RNA methyltransferase n=1 Tax=Acidimangrovimonas pyrenivorans TaxID=2030798 RepID=A0ABV7ADZ5_9RHOB
MTPAARLSAAIEILDRIRDGSAAEPALSGWARASRFAGSGDRAAIRDLVFTALRCRRSHAALGGADSGRGLILGGLREAGTEIDALFTGERHAPAPLSEAERAHLAAPIELDRLVALDCPDWLAPQLEASLGADFAPVMEALRQRAPVFLRVNTARATVAEVQERLAAEGIATRPVALSKTALEVTGNARKIQNGACYREGLVELQDAASQALVEALPLAPGQKVLDYCAGGGGKSLAMAARAALTLYAHDAAPRRMRDLGPRAGRAGAEIVQLATAEVPGRAPYDLVLLDVPCSGSGSWRRAPEAKWALTPERLEELTRIQSDILEKTAPCVAGGGTLAYATCSLLAVENGARIAAFRAAHPEWHLVEERRFTPLDGGDGFYLALLTRG